MTLSMIKDIRLIKKRMRQTQGYQKSYLNQKRCGFEFSVGDTLLIRVASYKHIMRFDKKDKLTSRFVGPFKVLKRVGKVTY